MADNTAIEWTDSTWNPVTGCDRVSPGCDHCYALTLAKRLKAMGAPNYQTDGDPGTSGPGFGVQCHPHMLDQPLRWKRPRRIFVNSMSDLFHPEVPRRFIAQVWATMARCPQHTFQILTKRPQRMSDVLVDPFFWAAFWESGVHEATGLHVGNLPLASVWLGTSIENDRYTFRADHLRATPAAVRFISAEPLLGPLPSLDLTGIDWVIAGGESGPGARPMHPQWVRDLRDRAVDSGVAFHFKQWGEYGPAGKWRGPDHHMAADGALYQPGVQTPNLASLNGLAALHRWGKKAAGRTLDGRTWDEFPRAVART